MPQEDKLKREIDRVGLALAQLLSKFLGNGDSFEQALPQIALQVSEQLDLDLHVLLNLPDEDALDLLLNGKKFSSNHIKALADLLYQISINELDPMLFVNLRHKARLLYEYVNSHGAGTLHFDVYYRLKELNGAW